MELDDEVKNKYIKSQGFRNLVATTKALLVSQNYTVEDIFNAIDVVKFQAESEGFTIRENKEY